MRRVALTRQPLVRAAIAEGMDMLRVDGPVPFAPRVTTEEVAGAQARELTDDAGNPDDHP